MRKAKFVLSKSAAMQQYDIMEKLADQVSYSMKTNFEIGKILENETSCMFSVHSLQSAELIKAKERILFFIQGLTQEELDELYAQKITSFVVDNEQDLEILLTYCEGKNWEINLMLRMRLQENTIHTGKHFVYGMYTRQINNLIPKLHENKLVKKLGIHFHRKTQNISEWSLKYELEDLLSKEVLKLIDVVNIGGGFPAEYKNYRAEILAHIFEKVKELKEWLNNNDVDMIIEPGRFIAAPAIKLQAEILNVYDNNIIINCSVFNGAMDTFVAHIRLLVEGELEKGDAYTIKGSTPDSMDIFRYRVFFDKKPKIGDKVTFLNAGAYNYSSDFCKLPKLETEVVA